MAGKFRLKLLILIIGAFYASLSFTANPSTSTVTVTIPGLVQISSINNITLTPSDFNSNITGNTTACIYTNIISPTGSYYVTATSANANLGDFQVSDGAHYITYQAYWNSTSSPTQTTLLSSDIKTTQQVGGNGSSLTCGGSPNANFNIVFNSNQLEGATPGNYFDIVILLISPS